MKRYQTLFIGLVVLLAVASARPTSAATLYVSPSSGNYTVGQTITVSLRIDTQGQPINASEGTMTWTTDTLQFVSLSSSGSIFKYWPIDPVVRGTGSIIYSGGLPSPGYTGTAGTVVRATFTAKTAGTGTVAVAGGKILANDGQGTDLFSGSGSANYTITTPNKTVTPTTPAVPNRPTPSISSTSHPDQNAWSKEPVVALTWTKPAGATGFSFQLSQDAGTIPDDTVDTTTAGTTLTLSNDGVWYFHVKAKYDSGWGGTGHYAIRLDRTAPAPFTPSLQPSGSPTNPLTATAQTTDTGSGVAKYQFRIDQQAVQDMTGSIDLASLAGGDHTLTVIAIDGAGNATTGQIAFSVTGYPAPVVTSVSSPLLLLDPLVVRGTAAAGDVVTVYVNGQIVGQVVAGAGVNSATNSDVTVRVPWVLTSDRLFRPGVYSVTATTTSTSGLVSSLTAATTLHVVGQAVMVNGRPLATWSVVTPVAIMLLSLAGLIFAIMVRLGISVWILHRHERIAEDELEVLRSLNQQGLTRQQLDEAITEIEDDLAGKRPPAQRSPRKRTTKRTR